MTSVILCQRTCHLPIKQVQLDQALSCSLNWSRCRWFFLFFPKKAIEEVRLPWTFCVVKKKRKLFVYLNCREEKNFSVWSSLNLIRNLFSAHTIDRSWFGLISIERNLQRSSRQSRICFIGELKKFENFIKINKNRINVSNSCIDTVKSRLSLIMKTKISIKSEHLIDFD